MSNRNEKGHFLPGHSVRQNDVTTKEIKELKKKSKNEFLKSFYTYGRMSINDLKRVSEHIDTLNPMQSGILKAWEQFGTRADEKMFKFIVGILGIPMESKHPFHQDVDNNEEDDLMELTKEEKKQMLQIAMDSLEKGE